MIEFEPGRILKMFVCLFVGFVVLLFFMFLFFPLDCHLWKKFLYLSTRCLFPSHEEHRQVGFTFLLTILNTSVRLQYLFTI